MQIDKPVPVLPSQVIVHKDEALYEKIEHMKSKI